MTVQELLDALADQPKDALAVLQIDPEGNGYYKVRGAEAALWEPDEGEAYSSEYRDWEQTVPCVVVYP